MGHMGEKRSHQETHEVTLGLDLTEILEDLTNIGVQKSHTKQMEELQVDASTSFNAKIPLLLILTSGNLEPRVYCLGYLIESNLMNAEDY